MNKETAIEVFHRFWSSFLRISNKLYHFSLLTLLHYQCLPQNLIRGFIACAPRLDKTAMLRRLYESSADNSPQDNLGFWIQRCGFRILGTGFRIPQAKNVPLIPKSGFPYLGRDNSALKSALRSRMTDRSSLRGAAVSAPRSSPLYWERAKRC